MKNKFGMGNRIIPYKNRIIDINKIVMVYRRLRSNGVVYSILQNRKVVGHTDCLMLHSVEFIVSEAGRKRVNKMKQKNVHAFAKGFIVKKGCLGTTAEMCEKHKDNQLPAMITYNPYKYKTFMCENLTIRPFRVLGAYCVVLNKYGLSASQLISDPK